MRALINKGMTTHEIATKLANGNPQKYKSVRSQLRRILATDDKFQAKVGLEAKGALYEGIVDVTEAMVRRGSRGNVPAAKLVYESSGFHNPRVEHKHSGKVEIAFTGVQRAPLVIDETAAGPIVDADVVED